MRNIETGEMEKYRMTIFWKHTTVFEIFIDKLYTLFWTAGLAWFVPLEDTAPWRKPLHERQAYIAGGVDLESGGKMDDWMSSKNQFKSDVYRNSWAASRRGSKLSLQVSLLTIVRFVQLL